jgi:hypothetical protein
MYKAFPLPFSQGDNLEISIKEILEFIRTPNNKDRGQGFISMGKLSGLVEKKNFEKYIDSILLLIHDEVKVPPRGRDGLLKL